MSSSASSKVTGPRLEFASQRKIRERNKTYYRVVAVDGEGKRSGPSDFAEGPRPLIYTQPVATAKMGTEYRYQVEEDIKPFRDVLLGLFFVTIGMLLNVRIVADNLGWVMLALVLPVAFKFGLIVALVRVFGGTPGTAIRAALALGTAGEFGFVLLGQAGMHGLLPPLVLHAFQTGSAEVLSRWAGTLTLPSPEVTFFNFLASHDGIGLNPLRGILTEHEIERVIERAIAHEGLVSMKSDPEGTARAYELNINYFDALNDPGSSEPLEIQIDRFIAAHAILLAMRGVPGIYFHSLFGSRGWPQGAAQTGHNRTINRQKFHRDQLDAVLRDAASRQARVFQRLGHLLQIRGEHSAFHPFGAQRVLPLGSGILALERTSPDGRERVLCLQNVSGRRQPIHPAAFREIRDRLAACHDLISGRSLNVGDGFLLEPYECAWLL